MTKSSWERASEKAQWDIKVALRGPDSNYGEVLKWFTTSVIRGQMSGVFRVGGQVNEDLQLVVLPRGDLSPEQSTAYKKAGRFSWNFRHFCDHIQTAAGWMSIPILFAEASVWHDAMALDSAKAAGEALIAAGEKYLSSGETHYRPYYVGLDELKRHIAKGVRF